MKRNIYNTREGIWAQERVCGNEKAMGWWEVFYYYYHSSYSQNPPLHLPLETATATIIDNKNNETQSKAESGFFV